MRARQVTDYFKKKSDEAYKHVWNSENQILIIDNRFTLHARAEVVDGDEQRELQRVAFSESRSK
jgi:alpha-ketoglutarate-dependent taurine dioxygenase